MALPQWVTKPVGQAARTVGRTYDYATPGSGTSRLTNVGRSISDPNQVYAGGSFFDGSASWVPVQSVTNTTTQGGTPTPQTDNTQIDNNQLSGGGGRYSGGSFDPSSIAEAQDALNQANNLLGRLSGQRDTAVSNLTSSYANYRRSLENDYGRNKGDYTTNRNTTIRDNEVAKQGIDSKVRSRSNALSRLLGSSGAGDSEAAYVLAPYAAARTGTQLRSQVNQQYGKNLSGLDQSWNQYNTDYSNSLTSLADEEKNKRNQTLADFFRQEAEARDTSSKAEAALRYAQGGNATEARNIRNQALPQIYQILQQIDALGKQQVTPTQQDASYVAPDLAQYTTNNMGDVAGVDPTLADNVDPMYQWLLRKQQEDNQFFGY
jgi:hypothetical protein